MLEDLQKADKIALAKRKLREYENRKHADANQSSNVSSVDDGRNSVMSNSSAISSEIHKNGMEEEKQSIGLDNSDHGSSNLLMPNHSISGSHSPQSSHFSFVGMTTEEREKFIMERDSLMSSYNSLKTQMHELHNHYSQLHAAYSQLTANGSHMETEKQVSQLQSVIAVMVEEKTSLNRDLRKAKEDILALQTELEKMVQIKADVPVLADAPPVSKDVVQLLQATKEELDSQRRITAEAQAQLLTVQHERSDAQARVKSLFREKEELENHLSRTRKDLQMKEIYLKQLSAHQSPVAENSVVDEAEIQRLHDKIATLEKSVENLGTEKDTICQDLELSRRNYEQYCQELSSKTSKMEADIEIAEQGKHVAELRVTELESQLSLLVQDMEQLRALKGFSQQQSTGVEVFSQQTSVNEEDLKKQIHQAVERVNEEWELRFREDKYKFAQEISEKDKQIQESRNALAELLIRYKNLEERSEHSIPNESELLSLSEQLQNEKATVSRAVAQNKELKQLLLDTEDRLVSLTEEKLQCELARQSAEHMVKELTRRLEESDNGTINENPVASLVSHTQQMEIEREESSNESAGFTSSDDYREREIELRNELEKTHRELSDMRNELRRSINQNQEMNQIMMLNAEDENQNSFHVELGQAVSRINVLSTENDQLRETISNLTQKLLTPDESDDISNLRDENSRLREEISLLNQRILTTVSHEEKTEKEQLQQQSVSVSTNEIPSDESVQENLGLKEDLARTLSISRLEQNNTLETLIIENQHLNNVIHRLTERVGQLETEVNNSQQLIQSDEPNCSPPEVAVKVTESSNLLNSSGVIGTDEWARVELEKKFSQAMRKNAELQENMERIEHINVQLQLENDTIADHVVLYQHQRRLIRERIRAKDLQLASLANERQRVIDRCQELQEALLNVLKKNGTSQDQNTEPLIAKAKRKTSRTYSHSTVDELSGDEEIVIPPIPENVPEIEDLEKQSDEVVLEVDSNSPIPTEMNDTPQPGTDYTDPDIKRIFSIINDINIPLQTRNTEKLQCTQCIGELKHI